MHGVDYPFEFGGRDLSHLLIVTGISRAVGAPRRIETAGVPGMDGAHVRAAGLDPLDLTVSCAFRTASADDVWAARRELAAALMGAGESRLFLPDSPYWLSAIYTGGAGLSALHGSPTVDLSFTCPDPVYHGELRRADLAGSAVIEAGGTWRAFPTVTAKPPSASSWQVTNVATGEFVRIQASFSGAQTVVLDMAAQRCTVNGADHAVDVSSDFFAIEGVQEIRISGGTARLEWEERWI